MPLSVRSRTFSGRPGLNPVFPGRDRVAWFVCVGVAGEPLAKRVKEGSGLRAPP